METDELTTKCREGLQGLEIKVKEWVKNGLAGGMGFAESEIINIASKFEKDCMKGVLKECGDGYVGPYIKCKWCSKPAKFKDRHEKRINTLCQEQVIVRAYYYCYRCGKGFCPLDDKLKIESQEISPGLRKITVEMGAQITFEPVAKILWETRRVVISGQTIRRVTEKTGKQVEEYEKAISTQQQLFNTKTLGRDQPNEVVLYSGGDGTSVNIRGEGWKQPKLSVTYEMESGRIQRRRYAGGFLNTDEFARRWKSSASQLQMGRDAQYVVIQDGADMLWNITSDILPQAIQILDWYHAKERLFTIGKLVFGEQSQQANNWSKEAETLLWNGKTDEAIGEIKKLKPRSKNAKTYVRQSIGYYTDNEHRMDYPSYREKGYNIGSGPVEGGACKNVVGDRLKRTGMRWSKIGAHNIIQARAALLDESIKTFWRQRYAISLP